ncbi:MAG: PsbP-related protein, partial [Planctomycetota bacterium]|nr:PsbP-related protein [Planctomycetota bacterium]
MHKNILAAAATAALLLGGLAAGGCGGGEAAPKAETYTSDTEGFSLTFPSDWKKSAGYGMNLEIIAPGQEDSSGFRDDIFVRVEGMPEAMPIEDYFSVKVAKGVRNMPDYKEIAKGNIAVGGKDARYLIYSYTNLNYNSQITSIAYFLTSGMRGYIIASNAVSDRFPDRKAAFEEIMKTFKLTGAAAPASIAGGPVKRGYRIILKLAVVLVALVAAGVVAMAILGIDEDPPDDSDMQVTWAEIPEADNAFTYFNQAAQKIYWPDERKKGEPLYDMLSGETWDDALAKEVLERNSEAFALFEKGMACPQFQFPDPRISIPEMKDWVSSPSLA